MSLQQTTTKSTSNKMILSVNDHCMKHVNSVVCTLIKIYKLANQIAIVLPIVVKYRLGTLEIFVLAVPGKNFAVFS